MELLDAIYARHPVRTCTNRPIEGRAPSKPCRTALTGATEKAAFTSSRFRKAPGPLTAPWLTMENFFKKPCGLIGKKSPRVQKLCGY